MVVTFVTSGHPSCVGDLDNRRLNKQRIEAKQILDTLLGTGTRKNHPSVLMWTGHTDALKVYINHCIRTWLGRGKHCELVEYTDVDENTVVYPWWFTWDALHLSHKCSLLRKEPNYYTGIFSLKELEKEWLQHGYIWPSRLQGVMDTTKQYTPAEVCSPIGAGAPAQYRWSIDETRKWSMNKLVNPRTGRAIKKDAKTGVYKDIERAYNHYVDEGLL